eukprot:1212372-Pyramimonas_sp.AAC.1
MHSAWHECHWPNKTRGLRDDRDVRVALGKNCGAPAAPHRGIMMQNAANSWTWFRSFSSGL